jgi:hypothetical protein
MAGGLQGRGKVPYLVEDAYKEEKDNRIRLMASPGTVIKTITRPNEVVDSNGKTELQKMMKKF